MRDDVEVSINGVDRKLSCTFYANGNSRMKYHYDQLMNYAAEEEFTLDYKFVDLASVNINAMIEAWQNGEDPTVPTTSTTATTTSTKPSSNVGTPDELVSEPTTTETKPQEIKATAVKLNRTKLNLTRYGSDVQSKLTATVTPNEVANKKVSWKSSNEKVATVDENGYVTAKGKGTAKITATTTDGSNLSATCTVTVKQMVTMIVNTMSINRSTKNVTKKLPVMVGNNASNNKLNYKSSNNKVVSVNSKGQITAKAKGTATIKITPNDGSNIVVNYRVTVKQLVTSVKLNKKSVTLKAKGKSKQYTLKATVTKNANNKSLKWTTTNSKIATVNQKGKVTAKKKGTCYIVATAKDGSKKTARCKVTVK